MAYTQLRIKCLECGLHFVVCTWNTEGHGASTLYCPKCGQHGGRYLIWSTEVDEQIFELVPGDAELSEELKESC